jgi:hypothetical protein
MDCIPRYQNKALATIEKTQAGDVFIRDLAYMSLEVLKKFMIKALVLSIP